MKGYDGPQDLDLDNIRQKPAHIPIHSENAKIIVRSMPDDEQERKEGESPRALYKKRSKHRDNVTVEYPQERLYSYSQDITIIPVHRDTAAEFELLIKEVQDEGRVTATQREYDSLPVNVSTVPRGAPDIPVNLAEQEKLPDFDMQDIPPNVYLIDYDEPIFVAVINDKAIVPEEEANDVIRKDVPERIVTTKKTETKTIVEE